MASKKAPSPPKIKIEQPATNPLHERKTPRKVSEEYLERLVRDSEFEEDSGEVAHYIPELGTALKEKTGVSVWYVGDAQPIAAGDHKEDLRSRPFGDIDQSDRLYDDMFTIQSISKVFALLYVLDCRGEKFVFKRIHKEPTGDPFNADPKTTKSKGGEKRIPFNPMINVGAIFITSLFPEVEPADVKEEVILKDKGIIKVPRNARIYRMSRLTISKMENEDVSEDVRKKLRDFLIQDLQDQKDEYRKNSESYNYYLTRDQLRKKLTAKLDPEKHSEILDKVLDYSNDGKFKMFMDFVRNMCGDQSMIVDQAVWDSESATGHNNRALAWRMHSDKIFFTERITKRDANQEVNFIEDVLSTYFRQCSILVKSDHLSHAAAVIAGGGKYPGREGSPFKDPKLDERLLSSVVSIMSNCGLYDGSGEFAYRVGLPGKSGVGGGIMCIVPGIAGIAVFSPALDPNGNSARGLHMLERISEKFKYNIFNQVSNNESKLKISDSQLNNLLFKVKNHFDPPTSCKPADYIPELGANKSSITSIALCLPGQTPLPSKEEEGNEEYFSLQSIANLFGLLYVLHNKSEGMIFKYVGKEPSGGGFNEMKWTIDKEDGNKMPFNPMINAGAIAIASMIPDKFTDEGRNFYHRIKSNKTDHYPEDITLPNSDQPLEYVEISKNRFEERNQGRKQTIDQLLYIHPFLEFVRSLCGDEKNINIDWDLFLSERKTGHNNRSLAWQMSDQKFFDKILARHNVYDFRDDALIEDILDVYFQMCSIKVTVKHLATFAGVLANGGQRQTKNGELIQLLTPREVAIATSMMSTSGLYNESGEFAYNVGIPSKSGVSGGIVSVVPGRLGLAVYSPAVNPKGNSCRGMKLLEEISRLEGLSIFQKTELTEHPTT